MEPVSRPIMTLTRGQWYFSILLVPIATIVLQLIIFQLGVSNRMAVLETKMDLIYNGKVQLKASDAVADVTRYDFHYSK